MFLARSEGRIYPRRVAYHPTAAMLAGEGARLPFDSLAMPEAIFGVLAVTPEAVRSHPDAIRHPVDAAYAIMVEHGVIATEPRLDDLARADFLPKGDAR